MHAQRWSVCRLVGQFVCSRTVAVVDTKCGYVGMCNRHSAQQESGASKSKNSVFTGGVTVASSGPGSPGREEARGMHPLQGVAGSDSPCSPHHLQWYGLWTRPPPRTACCSCSDAAGVAHTQFWGRHSITIAWSSQRRVLSGRRSSRRGEGGEKSQEVPHPLVVGLAAQVAHILLQYAHL